MSDEQHIIDAGRGHLIYGGPHSGTTNARSEALRAASDKVLARQREAAERAAEYEEDRLLIEQAQRDQC